MQFNEIFKCRYIFTVLFVSIFIFFAGYKYTFPIYASFFVVNNYSKNADAILILAGNPITRAPKAIELYENRYAKEILITTPIEKNSNDFIFPMQNDIVKHLLIKKNIIPIEIPSYKNGASSTFDEAYDLYNYLKDKNYKRIILVTDEFHTKRSLYAFKKIIKKMNLDLIVEVAGAKNSVFNKDNWYLSEDGIIAFVLEPIKLFVYMITWKNLEFIKES